MVVHSSETYTSIVNLFFHVSLCVAMSLCQKLYKDRNVYACDENKSSVTQNPFAAFSALNISGVLFLQLSLPYFQPCCVSLLLWSRFFFFGAAAKDSPGSCGWASLEWSWAGSWKQGEHCHQVGEGAAEEQQLRSAPKVWVLHDSTTHLQGTELENGDTMDQVCIQWTGFFLIIAAPKTSHQVSLS